MLKFKLKINGEPERKSGSTDGEFFAAFCEENQRAIWLAARRVLGPAREELAYDAAQETMVKLARQVAKLRRMSERERGAYAYQAARRNALNLAAAEARHDHAELGEQAGAAASPEARVVAKEGEQELLQALRELPEIYREVLFLNVIESVSSREAAAELGIGEAALRQRKRRGLALLREKLAGKTGGEGE